MKAVIARSNSAKDSLGAEVGLPFTRCPGNSGRSSVVQRSEQALNLAPPLRSGDRRIDDAKLQTGRDLIEVLAREIAAVIDIKHVGDAADGPSWIAFAPDCLSQRKAGIAGSTAHRRTP